MTPRIPTELDLLSTIFDRHYREFSEFSDENKTRVSKIWAPIDITAIAKRFRVATGIAVLSLFVSGVSILVAVFA